LVTFYLVHASRGKQLPIHRKICRGDQTIMKNIYAARKSLLPNLPKNIEEVHLAINNMDIKTTSEEQFLLVNDDSYEYI